ncbi:formylglycine-generating enzyme family protein [Variovorax sp. KK3]|uniref:formylglycine-generating enzyme family protein n=1 Tax=Variovorax sp. KK3 TaxID=1855728 RepID=UPI00117E8963|nr:formylglycine-generating enzyme family protein [Variovorax sp. KK3]
MAPENAEIKKLAGHEPNRQGVDPPVRSRAQALPFASIEWNAFESLVYQLVRKDATIEDALRYGTPGEAQYGIDIIARDGKSNDLACYQCKRVQSFSAPDIRKAVDTLLKGKFATEIKHFVLCVTVSLQSKTLVDEIAKQKQLLRDRGIAFSTWDASESGDLCLRLKSHPRLVDDFFGPAWGSAFNTPAPVTRAGAHELLGRLHAAWGSSPCSVPPDRETDAATLKRRSAELERVIPAMTGMDMRRLAWVPTGVVRFPDGRLLEVARPVALMCSAFDTTEAGQRRNEEDDPREVMATKVSRQDAERAACDLSDRTGLRWRLPTLAEWWMGVSAGSGRAPSDASASGGLWLRDVRPNAWRVRPPPAEAMEWVIDDMSSDGVIGNRGHWRNLHPHIRVDWVGFRLVLDYFEGAGS